MEKITEREVRKSGGSRQRRGPKRDKDRVTREEVLTVAAPPGSCFKGYRTSLVRDIVPGLMKTCRKLGISFFAHLGDRFGLNRSAGRIPLLSELVTVQPA